MEGGRVREGDRREVCLIRLVREREIRLRWIGSMGEQHSKELDRCLVTALPSAKKHSAKGSLLSVGSKTLEKAHFFVSLKCPHYFYLLLKDTL
jgi:hypothetical protein